MKLTSKTIREFIKKDDPVFFEIGAHHGEDTIGFLDEFLNIQIHCFEPDPRCIAAFKKNISDNRCRLIEAAVSSSLGSAQLNLSTGCPVKISNWVKVLYLTKLFLLAVKIKRKIQNKNIDWDYSSSIKKSISYSEDWPWLTFNKSVTVKTIQLDDYVNNNRIKHIDFIWLDVQGAEKDVIIGAKETLKIVDYVYAEYGATSCYEGAMTRTETIDLMKEQDFNLVDEHSYVTKVGNLLFRNNRLVEKR